MIRQSAGNLNLTQFSLMEKSLWRGKRDEWKWIETTGDFLSTAEETDSRYSII